MNTALPARAAKPKSALALRPDLGVITQMVAPHTRILDLGCGDGELLDHLVHDRQVKGRGVELSEEGVLACVRRGLSVRQGNLNEGLADYPDASFDYVILSQTLPFLNDPPKILGEMLRVGKRAIVSFPNWGYWGCRWQLLVSGRIPQTDDLPHAWYDVPRMQAFTITDFAHLCAQIGVRICEDIYLTHGRRMRIWKFKNLLATTAVFSLGRMDGVDPGR